MGQKNTITPATYNVFRRSTKTFDSKLDCANLKRVEEVSKYMRYQVFNGSHLNRFNPELFSYACDVHVGMKRCLDDDTKLDEQEKVTARSALSQIDTFLQNGILHYPDPTYDFWPIDTLWSKRRTAGFKEAELADVAEVMLNPGNDEWLKHASSGQQATLRFIANSCGEGSLLKKFASTGPFFR